MHISSQSLYHFVAWDSIIAVRLSQTSDADETVVGVEQIATREKAARGKSI
jgi:hypothetical protein